jgi:hypothetical protein
LARAETDLESQEVTAQFEYKETTGFSFTQNTLRKQGSPSFFGRACNLEIGLFRSFADVNNVREHRAEPRAGIMARIEVLWVDEGGNPRITPAKLEDKSPGGASFRIHEPISVGTNLTIQWPHGHFSGTVAYCNPHGQEFALGIHRDPNDEGDQR